MRTTEDRWQALWEQYRLEEIATVLNRLLRSDPVDQIVCFEPQGDCLVAVMASGEQVVMNVSEEEEQYKIQLPDSDQVILVPKAQLMGKPN